MFFSIYFFKLLFFYFSFPCYIGEHKLSSSSPTTLFVPLSMAGMVYLIAVKVLVEVIIGVESLERLFIQSSIAALAVLNFFQIMKP